MSFERLKILLYSQAYPPSLGGVETIAVTLATQLVQLGHDCVVVTETPLHSDVSSNSFHESDLFPVYRRPSKLLRFKLAKESSLIHSNGSSVAMYPYSVLAKRPFMWTHNGYQIQCVDGLGWVGDNHTPMTPMASLRHTLKTSGMVRATIESIKMAARRFVTNRVALNVACTKWVASRLKAPRVTVGYTPYDLSRFRDKPKSEEAETWEYEFIFVGRFVSEKGILDLVDAFAKLRSESRFQNSKLALVGDGPIRNQIEARIQQLNLHGYVDLLGRKNGADLVATMRKGMVGIVPSRWEEPMGGVALELLASGRRLVVSESGGIAECVEGAALTFPNGDVEALRQAMETLLTDSALRQFHEQSASRILKKFNERSLTLEYVRLYRQVLER